MSGGVRWIKRQIEEDEGRLVTLPRGKLTSASTYKSFGFEWKSED
jgi:hypothetical protein